MDCFFDHLKCHFELNELMNFVNDFVCDCCDNQLFAITVQLRPTKLLRMNELVKKERISYHLLQIEKQNNEIEN